MPGNDAIHMQPMVYLPTKLAILVLNVADPCIHLDTLRLFQCYVLVTIPLHPAEWKIQRLLKELTIAKRARETKTMHRKPRTVMHKQKLVRFGKHLSTGS